MNRKFQWIILWCLAFSRPTIWSVIGTTENAGRENDEPSKSRGMKMQGMKITDQVTGPENDGPSKSQGVKMQDLKMQDLKILDTKIVGMKQVIAHLLWSYRVLICNAVIWCSMLCWFWGVMFFFCIVCVCQVIMKITVIVIVNRKCSFTDEATKQLYY